MSRTLTIGQRYHLLYEFIRSRVVPTGLSVQPAQRKRRPYEAHHESDRDDNEKSRHDLHSVPAYALYVGSVHDTFEGYALLPKEPLLGYRTGMNTQPKRAVILVGHGAIPTDYPRELFARQRSLESARGGNGGDPSPEEMELDRKIRQWSRTAATDPYQAGLEALGAHLKRSLDGDLFAIAYNEFCAPTLEEAVQAVIAQGARQIRIVPSMLTPGGSHSEREIPDALAQLRIKHPGIEFRYAWPFDLQQVASMLASQLNRF